MRHLLIAHDDPTVTATECGECRLLTGEPWGASTTCVLFGRLERAPEPGDPLLRAEACITAERRAQAAIEIASAEDDTDPAPPCDCGYCPAARCRHDERSDADELPALERGKR